MRWRVNERDHQRVNVAVLDGGLAGIAAATRRDTSGINVMIFKAQKWVGGRVWPEDIADDGNSPGVVERGAEFVPSCYTSMLDRAFLPRATGTAHQNSARKIDPAPQEPAGLNRLEGRSQIVNTTREPRQSRRNAGHRND